MAQALVFRFSHGVAAQHWQETYAGRRAENTGVGGFQFSIHVTGRWRTLRLRRIIYAVGSGDWPKGVFTTSTTTHQTIGS